ncbi:MAG: acyl-[acyl-carrier-protein]--UDP-N-acetylglucosamine O-acyltransferase [Bacteroidetes bacterium]|nr:MAG: acyl-[acyl-carrier-protein]--UDP-N-acetylglucosamine O-acyltransferase [Bacteroidota bacterium]
MSDKQNYIHPKAKLGKNVIVDHFAYVAEDVEIGDGTWIGPNAVIMDGARIGKNCQIFPSAVISATPQDLKYNGEKTTVEIGDNVIIREFVTINRGTLDKHKTAVGENTLLMAYVHVAHDCILGKNCIMANNVALAGHIEIDDYSILEGLVAVQQFVKIGAHAFIAGASLIRKNVPPYVKAAREPLSYAGINSVGLRRRGFTNEAISIIEDIYRIIYVRSNNITQALNAVELEIPASEEKQNIIKFIRESTKGIIRGPSLS